MGWENPHLSISQNIGVSPLERRVRQAPDHPASGTLAVKAQGTAIEPLLSYSNLATNTSTRSGNPPILGKWINKELALQSLDKLCLGMLCFLINPPSPLPVGPPFTTPGK